MIKKLQRKFVGIATFSLLGVMVAVIAAINIVNVIRLNQNVDGILRLLSENDGKFPELPPKSDGATARAERPSMPRHLSEETPFETRYFIVRTDGADNLLQIDTGHIAAVSSGEAEDYAQKAMKEEKATGFLDTYKYLIRRTDAGSILVFVDCRTQIQTVVSFLIVSVSIALVSVFIVFLLVFIFSGRAIAPVAESLEKQKQFITDAGHELKTPIAILSANTDVLELTCGKNEWTESIRNQTARLNGLVQDLLTLSKMDEDSPAPVRETFLISQAVEETAGSFQSMAESQNKSFSYDIAPELTYQGDEEQIRRLTSILCDNAVKYAPEKGAVRLCLRPKGKAVLLTCENDCASIPQGDLNRLFDRFYRAENSRSRQTGGYGIGLSIARSIVNAHRGKISVSQIREGVICFRVFLP